ncbi:hypothetical protein GGX14DRAFT_572336 [Mycena pura]|uniref:Uncharacterized protein n=1 Tax=Mycena pura TaxID=153505 RepID=A0AAD6V1P8_9AGAR|nr:hypothetical protein GGX14DRAFT_572336 [Mycena pura]
MYPRARWLAPAPCTADSAFTPASYGQRTPAETACAQRTAPVPARAVKRTRVGGKAMNGPAHACSVRRITRRTARAVDRPTRRTDSARSHTAEVPTRAADRDPSERRTERPRMPAANSARTPPAGTGIARFRRSCASPDPPPACPTPTMHVPRACPTHVLATRRASQRPPPRLRTPCRVRPRRACTQPPPCAHTCKYTPMRLRVRCARRARHRVCPRCACTQPPPCMQAHPQVHPNAPRMRTSTGMSRPIPVPCTRQAAAIGCRMGSWRAAPAAQRRFDGAGHGITPAGAGASSAFKQVGGAPWAARRQPGVARGDALMAPVTGSRQQGRSAFKQRYLQRGGNPGRSARRRFFAQWIEHLRSTTDVVVPEELSRILDLVPRLRIIVKNLNNPDIVKRIISASEPSAQVAAEDDAVLLIHHDPFSRYKSIRQVSLGPDDIPSDDDLPALQGEPVQQDVTMTDVPSAKKKVVEIMEDELEDDDAPPIKQQKVKDDRKLPTFKKNKSDKADDHKENQETGPAANPVRQCSCTPPHPIGICPFQPSGVCHCAPSHPAGLCPFPSFEGKEVIQEARRLLMFAHRKQPVATLAIQRAEQELSAEMHTQMVRISNSLAYHNALAAKHKEMVALMLDRRISPVLAPIPVTPTAPRASGSASTSRSRPRTTTRNTSSRAGN